MSGLSAEGLGNRAAKSVLWSSLLRVAVRAIGFLRMAIIARILAPADFGLFAIALVFLNVLDVLSRPGIGEALIQKESMIKDLIDVSWTIKIIRGVALSSAMVALSPYVASYFGDQRVQPIITILALGVLIGGAGNPAIIYWTRELRMGFQCIYELAGQLVDITVAVALVYVTRSPLALAWGYTAGIGGMCVLSYVLYPYSPRLRWDGGKMRHLMRYGRWIWGDNLLYFALLQTVSTFIAKVLGAAALGLFQVAQKLVNTVTLDIAYVFSTIAFPLFSRVRADRDKLKDAFSIILFLTNGIVIPCSWLLFRFSTEIVQALFGAPWGPAATVVKILALYGILASLSSIHRSILNAVGRPEATAIMQGARFAVLLVLIVPAAGRSGLEGVALAMVFSALAIMPFELRTVRRSSPLGYRDLMQPLLATAGAMLAGELVYSALREVGGRRLPLSGRVLMALAVYGATVWLLDNRGKRYIPVCVGRMKLLLTQGG